MFLEVGQNSQENTCASAALRPATLLKRRLWHRCFPVNCIKFLRTRFLQNTYGRLLLKLGRLVTLGRMFSTHAYVVTDCLLYLDHSTYILALSKCLTDCTAKEKQDYLSENPDDYELTGVFLLSHVYFVYQSCIAGLEIYVEHNTNFVLQVIAI